ncbi:phosphatidylglycerophosphatase A family protein [Jannaschia sp. CCS1]|uniref:phosphatidylglycerophosphatase A family protein n=1 Tax=Jannaschia sp. (strain CCS1) TaxID=290400 RepID=UPI000053BD78|nr:phosphatidylglycerophosphatase A [Jannaschia sp. CCS1]ABD55151.1 phosphatidylglycerophosphatase [Jannaschia sp. CCS1]
MTRWITTVGGVGLLRPAPGTWGSAAGLVAGALIHMAGSFWLLFVATIAVSALGFWAVRAEVGDSDQDPSEIVIDEVAGQWVALWPVSFGAWMTGAPITALYPGLIVAFLAFRAFDILKPGPVGWADRQHGAFGIMADDLIAGWLAAMVVALFAVFAHAVLM